MKKILLLLIIAVRINSLYAQEYDTIPPYQKDSLHLPKFTILKIDSTYFNDQKIPENKPVVIIYFSPTCGHCQIAADEFKNRMKDLRHIYFVWVSYHPVPEIKDFANKFSLQQFNNLVIGRDENYTVPSYYKIQFTPYMAVYNKEHHLLQTFPKGTEADTLIELLKEE